MGRHQFTGRNLVMKVKSEKQIGSENYEFMALLEKRNLALPEKKNILARSKKG